MRPLSAPVPRVLGWVWIGVVALLMVDLVLNGSGRASLVAGAVLLVTAGGAYVLWLRPRVVPGDEGVRLVNPLRDTVVPWSAFTWADVTDVLRVHAGEAVFRSWPLRETRRSRVRENLLRARDGGPVPDDDAGQDPRAMRPVDLAARQLRQEAERRKAAPAPAGGAGAAEPVTVWAPDALAALGIPVLLLVAVLVLA
ncbi:PH domain-containing protein [Streptomonospora sp. S1-112]|uniref:PH domain-containing protein n=1 Tax=Streptomonospora mangrovi TaxID=2883123 RepID=A0A9X3NVD9_9ACTN|nr:PH domain-containing protein [Streptomonospora mangrovi]MDA0567590.1 PH domain-containing protein [Streptomonospora mangrovi]